MLPLGLNAQLFVKVCSILVRCDGIPSGVGLLLHGTSQYSMLLIYGLLTIALISREVVFP